MNYLAHGDAVVETTADGGLLDALTHQPVWVSLLIISFVMFGLYVLLEKLGVKPLNRLIALIPILILIAILYLEHNPAVTTVMLSVGFVASFAIAFLLLSAKDQKTENTNDVRQE